METYSIEADGHGQFNVRATRDDGESHVACSFQVLEQAQEWIDNQVQIAMKMATSSDIT
jgi:hypothetical protein